ADVLGTGKMLPLEAPLPASAARIQMYSLHWRAGKNFSVGRLFGAYQPWEFGYLQYRAGKLDLALAPNSATETEKIRAAVALREPGERQAHRGIEDRETDALDDAELSIGELQLRFDRLTEHGHRLPVGEVHGVREQEHEQQPAAIAFGE